MSRARRSILGLAGGALALALAVTGCANGQLPIPVAGDVVIVARNVQFIEPQDFEIPAARPLTIVLDNQDAGIPHGLRILFQGDRAIFEGPAVAGPSQSAFSIQPLAPGVYVFLCPVHEGMGLKLLAK